MKNLEPNRIAALGGVLSAVVAALVTLLGAVDSTPKALVVVAALLLVAIVVAVFLFGSQRWDELVFRRDSGTPDVKVETTTSANTPASTASDDARQEFALDVPAEAPASRTIMEALHPPDVGSQAALAHTDGDPDGVDPDGGYIVEDESTPDPEDVR